ncbi:hypothetical protein QUA57_28135, partial [Microcoleus sp. Pol7_B2]
ALYSRSRARNLSRRNMHSIIQQAQLTSARIEEELKGVEGLDWITALRAPQIRELVEQEAIQMSLFDQKDLAAIQSPDYPGALLTS